MADPYPRWRYYPLWRPPQPWVAEIVDAWATSESELSSLHSHLKSNAALKRIAPHLASLGFEVEGSGKVTRPVLFGDEGIPTKSFAVDGYRPSDGLAIEVESGGAVYNNRVLLDLLKMSLASDTRAGIIAVPIKYETDAKEWSAPYGGAVKLFDAIFANPERLQIPLEGLLLLGY